MIAGVGVGVRDHPPFVISCFTVQVFLRLSLSESSPLLLLLLLSPDMLLLKFRIFSQTHRFGHSSLPVYNHLYEPHLFTSAQSV